VWFTRHGGKTILLGRFVGLLRALAPFVAGVSVMPYRRFLPYNAAGAVLWATCFVLLGYGLDVGWRRVEHWTNAVGVLLAGGVALLLGLVWLRRRCERQTADGMRP
jgi:membrane-associated protein